jgi:hypothetical protein
MKTSYFPDTCNPSTLWCVAYPNFAPATSYHFYVEAGIPKSQVMLWVYGEHLRAVLDNVVLAEYRCQYDGQVRKVTDISTGIFGSVADLYFLPGIMPC